MQTPDRGFVISQLSALLEGRVSADVIVDWLTPVVLGELDLPDDDALLIVRLVHLIDDDSIGDGRKRILITRFVSCLKTSLNNAQVLQLFPLLIVEDRFCQLVQKYQDAVVTRTSIVSYVSSSGLSPIVSKWILNAPPQAVQYLCKLLRGSDYEEIAMLLRI